MTLILKPLLEDVFVERYTTLLRSHMKSVPDCIVVGNIDAKSGVRNIVAVSFRITVRYCFYMHIHIKSIVFELSQEINTTYKIIETNNNLTRTFRKIGLITSEDVNNAIKAFVEGLLYNKKMRRKELMQQVSSPSTFKTQDHLNVALVKHRILRNSLTPLLHLGDI